MVRRGAIDASVKIDAIFREVDSLTPVEFLRLEKKRGIVIE